MIESPTQPKEELRSSVPSTQGLGMPQPDGQLRSRLPHRRRLVQGAVILLLLAGILSGVRSYLHAISHESTDDAFIEGDIIPISPKVEGHVRRVHVEDNQAVRQGICWSRSIRGILNHGWRSRGPCSTQPWPDRRRRRPPSI